MDGTAHNLIYFYENKLLLEVPFFQRPYVWNEENWQFLYDDILEVADNRMPFIGTFIFQSLGDKRFSIIDGQQRMLTITIMIKALLDTYDLRFYSEKDPYDYVNLSGIIMYQEKINGQKKNVFKMTPSNADKEGFYFAMSNKVNDEELLEKQNSNIVRCYKFFKSKFMEMDYDSLNKYEEKILTSEHFFIVIKLDPNLDDEQKIFDSVNSLGQRLTSGDIIKNFLYQSMKLRNPLGSGALQEIIKIYSETWDNIFYLNNNQDFWYTEISLGRYKTTNLEAFLKDFGAIKGIYKVAESGGLNNLASSYKKYLIQYDYNELVDFAYELADYAKIYKKINVDFNNLNNYEIKDSLNTTLLVLKALKHTTFNPYILKLIKEHPEDMDQKLYALQRFVIARQIYRASPKNYNKITETLLTTDDPIDYLEQYNKNTEPLIDFDSFPIGLTDINNSPATLILFLIEMIRRDAKGISKYSDPLIYANKSLEHVMPQKWQTNWFNVPCFDMDDKGNYIQVTDLADITKVRNKRIYSIGNMTLLSGSLNKSISNETFRNKIIGKGDKMLGIKEFVQSLSVAQDIVDIYNQDKNFDERNIAIREEELFNELNNYYHFVNHNVSNNTSIINNVSVIQSDTEQEPVYNFTDEYFQKSKVGAMVRETMTYLFTNDLLSEEDITNLRDQVWTKKNLGCDYACLTDDITILNDKNGYCRYYKKLVFNVKGNRYYLTSEWYNEDRKKYVSWFKSIINR